MSDRAFRRAVVLLLAIIAAGVVVVAVTSVRSVSVKWGAVKTIPR